MDLVVLMLSWCFDFFWKGKRGFESKKPWSETDVTSGLSYESSLDVLLGSLV